MMHSKRTLWFLAATAVCLALVAPALADDAEKEMEAPAMDPEAMQGMWDAMRAPGENHEFLARLEGEWTFDSTMWMAPSAPPMKSSGTATKKMILGGRYLQEDVHGEVMEQPFHGRGVTGFDNVTGEFMATWIDDMATGVMYSRGSRDGDALTLHSEMMDPMSKQLMKLRMVTRVESDDHHVFEYYVTMPGMPEEMKQMVIEYRRASGE